MTLKQSENSRGKPDGYDLTAGQSSARRKTKTFPRFPTSTTRSVLEAYLQNRQQEYAFLREEESLPGLQP